MKLTVFRLNLPLKHAFTIARNSIQTQSSLIVELEHDGVRGYGEVTEDAFYRHTYDSMLQSLRKIHPGTLDRYAAESPSDLWTVMHDQTDGDMFALSALDMAAHDWHGKRLGYPTWKVWQLANTDVVDSSFTIGIDTTETMVRKLREEPGWRVYKIKLGTERDIEIVTELRRHTDAVFRVDANCGWSADQAIDHSARLATLGVEFIEQPLPIDASQEDKQRVYRESALPIIADEDCQVSGDVERCGGLYHGVNVKLCKCGGLSPALQMLTQARRLGLKTMIGCMVESSIGISGAAQLLPLLDFADLDGAVLLADEPCVGVRIDKGIVVASPLAGCGGDIDHDRLTEFLASPPLVVGST
ncbi:L-Ala-D/L-Glu epimerase [Stieleria maiorica]|uniref:Dipeptide epimerase n=1 Tax=Stieleria maiorica TaxID=2795974 RepID=A0A5B9M8K8_9BACT|nr:dipeptide epimerase [Stieleria maiorica]QEF97502.1 L-Ala-D/L-Glu epimerase [Stieleria maiorica]